MLRLSPLLTLSLSLLLITFTHFLYATHYAAAAAHPLKLPLRHIYPSQSLSQTLSSDNHHRLNRPQFPIISGASTGAGQYFVDLHIGTPPQRLVLVTDTGSDLIWVTCSACRNCSARPPGSAFLARQSKSYSLHHCYDSACRLVPHPSNTTCNRTRRHSPCRYEYTYSDGSLTSGFFAKETVTFNTTSGMLLRHHAIAFGCGFEISGPSVTGPSFNGAQGVLGLGRGPISLATQLGNQFGNKFSYCLIDYTISPPPTSYLLIGGDGTENGADKPKPNVSYTPLQNNTIFPTFYYVGIKSVYVDKVKLRISPSVFKIDNLGNGGTIMDSGTTLTFLPDPVYTQIVAAFNQRVKLPRPSKPNAIFDLCLNVSGITRLSLPKLSFQLAGNSILSPPVGNYFIDVAQNVKCLALQPVTTSNRIAVIGNLMQQGFLFEFDLEQSRLGFTRHGCAIP